MPFSSHALPSTKAMKIETIKLYAINPDMRIGSPKRMDKTHGPEIKSDISGASVVADSMNRTKRAMDVMIVINPCYAIRQMRIVNFSE